MRRRQPMGDRQTKAEALNTARQCVIALAERRGEVGT
jgi:hypothetical protein